MIDLKPYRKIPGPVGARVKCRRCCRCRAELGQLKMNACNLVRIAHPNGLSKSPSPSIELLCEIAVEFLEFCIQLSEAESKRGLERHVSRACGVKGAVGRIDQMNCNKSSGQCKSEHTHTGRCGEVCLCVRLDDIVLATPPLPPSSLTARQCKPEGA